MARVLPKIRPRRQFALAGEEITPAMLLFCFAAGALIFAARLENSFVKRHGRSFRRPFVYYSS